QYNSKSHQLSLLRAWGIDTVESFSYVDYTTAEWLNRIFNDFQKSMDYELDGIVIDIDEGRSSFPSNGLNPGYSKKFKPQKADNYAVTEVVDVKWNVSKWGYIKPT